MKSLKILGIDLAKNIFHLHGVDEKGVCVLKKRVLRRKLLETLIQVPQTLVAMEACSGASYWARQFRKMGHETKLIPPQYVRPFVKTNKNDETDAAAICEAASRCGMSEVAVKQVEHQDIQAIHRVRHRLVKQRVCLGNEIRGLIQEYGIVIPQGKSSIRKHVLLALEEADNDLSDRSRILFRELLEEMKELDERILCYDKQIRKISQDSELCQRLEKIEGVGPLTSTIFLASVPDPKVFKNGRSMSAWLGLVPRHWGTGGKNHLGKMSKRGNPYIRFLMIHGARSALLIRKETRKSRWAKSLLERKGHNKACVALANKTARIIWALMAKGTEYHKEDRLAA